MLAGYGDTCRAHWPEADEEISKKAQQRIGNHQGEDNGC